MIDPTLERRLSDCRELVGNWKEFHEFFKIGVRGQDINPDKEALFLQIKSKIAMLHDSFLDSLTHDQNIAQNIITIVARCITLKHLHRLGPAEIKKMEIEWHESYLLLNETVALLEEKKEAMDKINPTEYKMQKMKERFMANAKAFFTGVYFKILVVIIVIFFLLVGLPMMGVSYKKMRDKPAGKKVYDLFADVYRAIIKEAEFDEVAQAGFDSSILGKEFTAEALSDHLKIPNYIKSVLPEISEKCSAINKDTEFKGYAYKTNGAPIIWGEYFFKTTKEAKEITAKYKDYYNKLSDTEKNDAKQVASKLLIFNKRNIVVLMFFKPDLRGNADIVKRDGYKVTE